MSDEKTMDDRELQTRGIKALNEAVGPSAALSFLGGLGRQPSDYVDISRRRESEKRVGIDLERACR